MRNPAVAGLSSLLGESALSAPAESGSGKVEGMNGKGGDTFQPYRGAASNPVYANSGARVGWIPAELLDTLLKLRPEHANDHYRQVAAVMQARPEAGRYRARRREDQSAGLPEARKVDENADVMAQPRSSKRSEERV